jgi:branched-chain amino acid transport system substrate-binding protein
MLIGGPSDTTALVIEQARNLGFKGGFAMVDQAKMDYISEVGFKGDLSKMNNLIGSARVRDIAPPELMDPFIARYKKEYNRVPTSENVLNYAIMRILAAAMEAAGSVDDPKAIKAAFRKVLPMDIRITLIHYTGLQKTRMTLPSRIQMIEDGKFSRPIQNVWWFKKKEDYEKLLPDITSQNAENHFLPLEGYAQ